MNLPSAIAIASAATLAMGAGAALAPPDVITPTSIGGAATGQAPSAYRSVFGSARTDRLEGNITRLVFNGKQTDVYVQGSRGTAIVTANPAFKAASGVGPCSTFAQLKAAYPGITRVPGTFGLGWKWGRLWFRVEDGSQPPDLTKATVRNVMLVPSRPGPMAKTFLGNAGGGCGAPTEP